MPLSTSDSLRLTRTCTTVPSTSKVFPCRYLHFSFHPSTFLKHTTSSEHSTFRFYVAKLFLSTTRILSKICLSLSLLFLFSKVYPWPVLISKNSIPNCSLSSFANYSTLFLFLFLILSMYLFVYTQVYLPVVIPTTEDGGVLHPQLSISYVTVYRRKVFST